MHLLVVDDEPLAREALKNVLQERNDIDHYEFASDAVEALAKLSARAYDIVLLDIHMPELSGIALVDKLQDGNGVLPAIIFVTAYDEHAIAAFDRQAVDYILKPFGNARVHKAIDNAKRRSNGERVIQLMEIMPQLESMTKATEKIAIKSKGRVLFIDPSEIIVVEAEGNYVLLQQESGSHLLREQISTLSETLKPYGFIRIHRSVLVNSSHIEMIEPLLTGEYLLRTRNGKEYNVTRTYKKNLKSIARLWIGIDSLNAV